MDARRAKQAIYGTFYFLIWAGIISAIYFSFLKPLPSCFDNVQNQGEQGVDCGGPCAKVCLPANLTEISPLGVSTFISSPGHYTFLAQVANENPGFAAQSFDYAINLYDVSGTLIDSIPGQSFLYAGEVKYLLVPNLALASPPANASITLAGANWVAGATMGEVPDWNNGTQPTVLGFITSSSTITVAGQLTDSDVAAFTNILIIAVFRDENENPIGSSQTILDSIAPDQTENFSVMYPVNPAIVPALTQFYAYALR